MENSRIKQSVTDVVITNWRRPRNIPLIVSSIQENTLPSRIILIDAGDESNCCVFSGADEKIRLHTNYGCYNRYLATPILRNPFVFLTDDDFCVGPKFLETMVGYMIQHPEIGLLGQIGRIVDSDGTYNFRDVKCIDSNPVRVDTIVRGYFARTELARRFICEPQKLPLYEDDLAFSCFIRRQGFHIGVVNNFDYREKFMVYRELANHDSVSARPNHLRDRTAYLKKQILETGWKPLKGL